MEPKGPSAQQKPETLKPSPRYTATGWTQELSKGQGSVVGPRAERQEGTWRGILSP